MTKWQGIYKIDIKKKRCRAGENGQGPRGTGSSGSPWHPQPHVPQILVAILAKPFTCKCPFYHFSLPHQIFRPSDGSRTVLLFTKSFFVKFVRFPILKVGKFQKQIFLFSFEPKNKRNYFLISALASKNGSNQKSEGTLLY